MTSGTRDLLERIGRRAAEEPEHLLPVLRLLAGEEPDGEAPPDPAVARLARTVNAARVARARAEFAAGALTTGQVAELIGVGSRQAVAQRRARGGLLGVREGRTTLYPAWQFDVQGVASGLEWLLARLPRDARSADAVMRTPHSGLGGRTLADLFAAGDMQLLDVWLAEAVDPAETPAAG